MAINKGVKIALISGGCVVGAALITGAFSLIAASKSSPGLINQNGNQAPSAIAGGDLVQSTGSGSAVKTTGPVNITTIVGDTSGQKKGAGSEPTVKMDSHQSGGVSIGVNNGTVNYIQAKSVFLVVPSAPGAVPADTTCHLLIDTVAKTITFYPLKGAWDSPFAAIPSEEQKKVAPALLPASGKTIQLHSAQVTINGVAYYAMTTPDEPARPKTGYMLRYDSLPTNIVFGYASGPLFKAKLQ